MYNHNNLMINPMNIHMKNLIKKKNLIYQFLLFISRQFIANQINRSVNSSVCRVLDTNILGICHNYRSIDIIK